MSFMFMAFLAPLPFSFLFFFFLQQHFLQMQKQQVSSRRPVTTAMAISAQGGTAMGRWAQRCPPGSPHPTVKAQTGSAHLPPAPSPPSRAPSRALLRRDWLTRRMGRPLSDLMGVGQPSCAVLRGPSSLVTSGGVGLALGRSPQIWTLGVLTIFTRNP